MPSTRARPPGAISAVPTLRACQTVPRSSTSPWPPGAIAPRASARSPTTESLTTPPGGRSLS